MKIGAFTILFDEVDWLRAVLPQMRVFDPIVVISADRPHCWSDLEAPPPHPPTAEIERICTEAGATHVHTVLDSSLGPVNIGCQRNAGMAALREVGCEAAAWFAGDEMYTLEDAQMLRACIESDPCAVWLPDERRIHTLWWNVSWEITYWAPINGLPIHFDCEKYDAEKIVSGVLKHAPITCWHFAFARPEEEMRRKFFGWGHAHPEHSPLHWRAWDGWRPGRAIYWPGDGALPARVPEPLPEEIALRLGSILPRLRPTPQDDVGVPRVR